MMHVGEVCSHVRVCLCIQCNVCVGVRVGGCDLSVLHGVYAWVGVICGSYMCVQCRIGLVSVVF